MKYYAGIDIGGTKTSVTIWSVCEGAEPALESKDTIRTRAYSAPADAIDAIVAAARSRIAERGIETSEIAAAGISCGGPLDREAGVILSPPNLPGWDRVPIVEQVSQALGVPAAMENDANACALAEWKFGAGRGLEHLVFLTFGTGLGAGVILNGRLHRGASGAAGEIGHVRIADCGPVGFGKAGSAEGFCSGAGIAQLAGTRAERELSAGRRAGYCATEADLENITAAAVARAAFAGDAVAREVYEESGRRLGQVLAIIVDLLNPELIVIGSVFARARDLLWPAASAVLAEESLSGSLAVCRVEPPGLGESVGDYAALAVALDASKPGVRKEAVS